MPAARSTAEGHLFAIEGIDGSGKSTVIEGVVDLLRAHGRPATVTGQMRSPIGQEVMRAVREGLPTTVKTLLFAADRALTLSREVGDVLARGGAVLWDRYTLSNLAYRSADAREDGDLSAVNAAVSYAREINAVFPIPAKTIVLDVAVDIAIQRCTERGRTSVHSAEYLEHVRALFLSLEPGADVVDASQPLSKVVESVHRLIVDSLEDGPTS